MADTTAGTDRRARTRRSGRADADADRSGPAPTLRILETRVLRGPNYWAREPVIRLLVDLGVLEEYPSNKLPGFTDALVALLPTLEDHACSLGRRGGFITRLRDGTWVGHIAEHIALEFQNLAGTDVRHGKTRARRSVRPVQRASTSTARRRSASRPAGWRSRSSTTSSRPTTPTSSSTSRRSSSGSSGSPSGQAFGPSTQALIDEAVSRDIPFIRLDRHSLVQLGQGVHQQRIRATMTSQTSAIGVDIASDKSLTNRLLDSAGLPVPRADVVDTEDGAVAAAQAARLPVRGQAARRQPRPRRPPRPALRGGGPRRVPRRARAEPRRATSSSRRYVAGNDYRCLVIGGKVAAIAERVPASVTGDGEHTVRELVDIANSDPRRGIGHEKVLTRIKVDEAAEALVRAQGYELDEVLPDGDAGSSSP